MEKVFLTHQWKMTKKTYEQINEMGRNNDYTAGNLLNYEYFSKH